MSTDTMIGFANRDLVNRVHLHDRDDLQAHAQRRRIAINGKEFWK